jgi:hypothetical protein
MLLPKHSLKVAQAAKLSKALPIRGKLDAPRGTRAARRANYYAEILVSKKYFLPPTN